jgi:poly(A) polymerase
VAAPSLRLLDALDALKILLPPVAAHFKEQGRRGQDTFYAFAEALDRRVTSGETLDDAILLAALLVPIAQASPVIESLDSAGRPSVSQAIEDLLAEFVQTARLPRRIAERCRLLLIAQRTLSGERRKKTGAFRRHPLFADALVVFEICVEATGRYREALEAWKRGDVPSTRSAPGAEAEGDAPRKRRRRRRRGGSRPKSGPSEGASTPAGAGSSEVARAGSPEEDSSPAEEDDAFDEGDPEEDTGEDPDEDAEGPSDEG